jgi:hypothetical protein
MLAVSTFPSISDPSSRALAEGGVHHTLTNTRPEVRNTRVIVEQKPIGHKDYQRLQGIVESNVDSQLGWAIEDTKRFGQSQHLDLVGSQDAVPEPSGGFLGRTFFYEGFEDHVNLIAGRWPEAAPVFKTNGIELEGVVGRISAAELGIREGSTVYLVPFRNEPSEKVAVRIVGLAEPKNPGDEYWMGFAPYFELVELSPEVYSMPIYIGEPAFFGGLAANYPRLIGEYTWFLYMDVVPITADRVDGTIEAFTNLDKQLNKLTPRTLVLSGLDNALQDYLHELKLKRVMAFLFIYILVATLLYFLFLVLSLVAHTWREEAGLLRSRGAGLLQTASTMIIGQGIWILAAMALGPLLAIALVWGLISRDLISEIPPDSPVSIGLSVEMYLLAIAGGLLSLALVVLLALRATRSVIVDVVRERSRPARLGWVQRYHLDIALLLLLGLLWWQLRNRDGFATRDLATRVVEIEPALFLIPGLTLLGVALLLLRLLPIIAATVERLGRKSKQTWLYLLLQRISRNPLPYSHLLITLILVSGLAAFAITFRETLTRYDRDEALYSIGGDVVIYAGQSNQAFQSLATVPEVKAVSPIFREKTEVFGKTGASSAQLLAADHNTLSQVSWFRSDFSSESFPQMLLELGAGKGHLKGIPLPANASDVGLWARMDNPGPQASLLVRVLDGQGWYHTLPLGELKGRDWEYFQAPLQGPMGPLQEPVHLVSIFTRGVFQTTFSSGSISLDDISVVMGQDASTLELVHGFEVTYPWQTLPHDGLLPDQAVRVVESARNGRFGLKFSWSEPLRSGNRGPILPPGPFPLPAIGSPPFAKGDSVQLFVAGRRVPVEVTGVVDYLPTTEPLIGPVALVDHYDLQEYLAAIPNGRAILAGEFWVSLNGTDDREGAIASILQRLPPPTSALDSQSLVQGNLKNPLGGIGWRGLAALSLAAALALGAIILILHGIVVINDSKVDLAVVRVLGISTTAPWISIICEFVVIVVVGTAAGLGAGVLMARWTLSKADFTPTGYPLVPPYSVGINWWLALALIVGVAGAAVIAIVLTGRRAARQRASEVLRLGN